MHQVTAFDGIEKDPMEDIIKTNTVVVKAVL